jgi:hypothetical protein
MPFTCCRNFTNFVLVSGTVSTPRLLKLLSVSPIFGGVKFGSVALSRACCRIWIAAVSELRTAASVE